VKILVATDSFPPNCGGSGWSTYELVRGLRARGHEVRVVQPIVVRGDRRAAGREYDGFTVDEIGVTAPNLPYVRNYFKNERLYRHLAVALGERLREFPADVVHGQHVLTVPPAVAAARAAGVAAVATVRDYWPVCYWSDLIHDPHAASLCPSCTTTMMTQCIRPRAGPAWPLALPLIPYMRSNLAAKRRALARADAVVAVSSVIEQDLRERAPELAGTIIVRIPNPVACAAIVAEADRAPAPRPDRYAIYAGKLAPNKGVDKLVPALVGAGMRWPLVVVGDGPSRAAVERDARAAGLDATFTGWLPRAQALAWLRHASLVVFPSHGPESLSRVLLEAGVLGRPIAAMDTGGTRDIIRRGETGLLSVTVDEFARDIARLASDAGEAARLGRGAADHVRRHFDAASVVERMEAVYHDAAARPRRPLDE
jgi:glycogen synthase